MSKLLPYFQFEPAQWLTGNIIFCSPNAQSLFIKICCYYWQRDCDLTIEQLNRLIDSKKVIDELVKENILTIENGSIKIDFLYEQYENILKQKKNNSENGKKGAEKKWSKHKEIYSPPISVANGEENSPPISVAMALREDNIIEDKIITNNNWADLILSDVPKYLSHYGASWKLELWQMIKMVQDFDNYLKSTYKVHGTLKEYGTHFANWGKTRFLSYQNIPDPDADMKQIQRELEETRQRNAEREKIIQQRQKEQDERDAKENEVNS